MVGGGEPSEPPEPGLPLDWLTVFLNFLANIIKLSSHNIIFIRLPKIPKGTVDKASDRMVVNLGAVQRHAGLKMTPLSAGLTEP